MRWGSLAFDMSDAPGRTVLRAERIERIPTEKVVETGKILAFKSYETLLIVLFVGMLLNCLTLLVRKATHEVLHRFLYFGSLRATRLPCAIEQNVFHCRQTINLFGTGGVK